MTSPSKITLLSLRTYPAWWQERYRDEMDAVVDGLIEDGQSSFRISFNLLWGSLRARLLGTGAPASRDLWSRRTQTALLVATLPWFAMIPLVVIFFVNGGEYGSFNGGQAVHLSRAGAVSNNFASIVFVLLLVSLFIVVFGWSRLRDGLAQRQQGAGLPRASVLAAIIGVVLVLIALPYGLYTATATGCLNIIGSKNSGHCVTGTHGLTFAQIVAFTGLGLLVVAFVLAPFVIARAVRRSDLRDESLRSGSRVATTLSTLFVIMALAIAACGVAASLQPTPQKGMSYYLERSALGGWYVLLVAGFVAMAVVSNLGTFAARRSYRRTVALEG
jgi:hypothetical protein